tara:strand:+ start:979 stop:1662 length:684 start_codon:yes stop_codon:yes gene_type:complete
VLPKQHYLLIGNSRWHWAYKSNKGWEFFDTDAPESNELLNIDLKAWAVVGRVSPNLSLNPDLQLNIDEIPLLKLPPWLGIDRALAGWGAFKKMQVTNNQPNGILIVDAGTVFSMTRIKANGEFAGGKLIAGLKLQLNAMAQGTRSLKEPHKISFPEEYFPVNTQEAMLRGTLDSLIGVVCEAQNQASAPVWLCGGNGLMIYKELQKRRIDVIHYPNLVLEGMIDLKS